MVKAIGFTVFRFSISWSRIQPDAAGKPTKDGIEFFQRVIGECLKLGLIPFLTLDHWDLPAILEKEGGWTSHLMSKCFNRYVTLSALKNIDPRSKTGLSSMNRLGLLRLAICWENTHPEKRG